MERDRLRSARAAWRLGQGQARELTSGHINRTWLVTHRRGQHILQWVNPLFGPEVNLDIAAVTGWLEQKGLATPRLVPTAEGRLWVDDDRGGIWRLMTHWAGTTLVAADSAHRCREAGLLLGRFHHALGDFDYEFRHQRLRVHDLEHHLQGLHRALQHHRDHPSLAEIEPVAARIIAAAQALDLPAELPQRVVHGDPKISNFIFADDGQARCLVDLDTLGRMPLAVELGDAFRSWCAPLGEEVEAPFQLDYFEAGLAGYVRGLSGGAHPADGACLPLMIEAIALELAARFAADALVERYFNWDRQRFSSASAHNLCRARAQLALSRSIAHQRRALARATAALWR